MSWKSLVTAGLLCVLASPAFAAPNVGLVAGGNTASGHLDANNNWVWTVQVTPDLNLMPAGDTSGTPVAIELGFTSSASGETGNANPLNAGQGNLVSANQAGAGETTNFDTPNPGKQIFGWEAAGTCNANGNPCGIQTNSGTKQVFAALGSAIFTTAGAKSALDITTKGPAVNLNNTVTKSTITVSGAYGGNGRVAQITGGTSGGPYTTGPFDTFGGASYTFTMQARGGDTELNGTNDFTDIQN